MKDLQLLTNALDAAIKEGVFNLQEAGNILQAINNLGAELTNAREAKAVPPKKKVEPKK